MSKQKESLMRKWLKLPTADNLGDLDDPSATRLHAKIIWEKIFLRKIYIEYYQIFQKSISTPDNKGLWIELGSGGGFAKKIIPGMKTSDVLFVPGLDFCCTGEQMPFADNSVDGFFMIDVFHHIKKPRNVLRELDRCLKKNGQIVMIEPANTLWGRFIFQNFHHETFDPTAGWSIEGTGPLSDANGALPWIIFSRDRRQFESEFPSLKIEMIKPRYPFRYLLSGGVSMRQLVPSCSYNIFKALEWVLTPLNKWIGMFQLIRLKKTS